uniref:Tyrosine-protein kinase receptor n=1 Tax=Dendroctonus ponderosae TaxID=77166 RepID=A0AAR5P3V4_DENPD
MTALKNIFTILLIYLLRVSACQIAGDQPDGAKSVNLGTRKRPELSNIKFVNHIDDGNIQYHTRLKRTKTIRSKILEVHRILREEDVAQRNNTVVAQEIFAKPDINITAGFKKSKADLTTYEKIDKLKELKKESYARHKPVVSKYDCKFENDCCWTWRKDEAHGFFITSGGYLEGNQTGPPEDAGGKQFGSYLILRLPQQKKIFQVVSPLLLPTYPSCKLFLSIYQYNMVGGEIRVIGDKTTASSIHKLSSRPMSIYNNHTQWVVRTIHGNNYTRWLPYQITIGKLTTSFTIILEVVGAKHILSGATVAFDNIELHDCFFQNESCSPHQHICSDIDLCINSTSTCDFNEDCPEGDDERLNCDKMPYGARCTFENDDWCGWKNLPEADMHWRLHKGSTPLNFTGPNFDHTYLNSTGSYLYVNMLHDPSFFGSQAILRSVTFNAPPGVTGDPSSRYYNTCAIRVYLHKTGKHKSGVEIQITELKSKKNLTTSLFWSFMEDHGDQWMRQVFILPNITNRYFVEIIAKRGYRFLSDIGLDDVSLSPECFGINIPKEDLRGYDYWSKSWLKGSVKQTAEDFRNKTYFNITTCNNEGRYGPSPEQCAKAYNRTGTNVKVLLDVGLRGTQKWVAPREGYYTFILAGASGGKNSRGIGGGKGAEVTAVMNLRKGQELFISVGQEGNSACLMTNGLSYKNRCDPIDNLGTLDKLYLVYTRNIITSKNFSNAGGGGGATYIFMRNRTKHSIPIAIAGGGGGESFSKSFDPFSDSRHGQGLTRDSYDYPTSVGYSIEGAGGGWAISPNASGHASRALTRNKTSVDLQTGGSLLLGGVGGSACSKSSKNWGDGGFGGGGGSCIEGGGGGGYYGGEVVTSRGSEGGTSYVDMVRSEGSFATSSPGQNQGAGYVMIIPAIEGCDCDYQCVALDSNRSETACVCPKTWKLHENKKSCLPLTISLSSGFAPISIISMAAVTIFAFFVGFACFLLYIRYQKNANSCLRGKNCAVSDVQLNRLRHASGSVATQYNPNYEFGGVVTTISDLQHIPRDQLRLVKALGQGAFGEVYQGFYRQRPCDTVEMPVAVKTLQEMTVKQAEDDFLTEALIMSKFNHPNIVHFIGVCFDKHPKFIVLELLTGGDLKNFLRESRPKADRPSTITMKDLVFIAIDIGRGCKYLEDKRFIHRDIAARNCLLTTKGPGRVTKIADFGMSRDIYRADYYRKDGKAMLPVKWMPPEAFLEGLFSSKTDVWSFGILLWEIMKMGFMPYTGCTNKEVMDLVVQGGRLERPESCPAPIYGIMASCWHPQPEDRPTFAIILERLGYCAQDPDVLNAPLPTFYVNTTNERDTTVIRPSDSNDNCLQVLPYSTDYLIPDHPNRTNPDAMESTSSVEKLIPDSSHNHWETSFIMPNSKSTQPLLQDSNKDEETNHTIFIFL